MVALDNAIRTSTIFSNTEEAIGKLIQDLSDTETRLQKTTGMVIGAANDYSADTGAITGSNVGGSTVKNTKDIVPESGDLSTATLPEPGSTVPITYTGEDGQSFTFYAKYPDSFSTVVQGFNTDDGVNPPTRIIDKRYHVDLNTIDDNFYYEITSPCGNDTQPSNHIRIAIDLFNYGNISPTDPNLSRR